jgi:hypothetical protein
VEVAAGRLARFPAPLAVAVDERVRQDAVQPGLEVGAGPELVEGRVRLGRGLLHEVFGVGRVARHAEGSRVQLSEEGHHITLEPLVAVRRLFCVPHRVSPLLIDPQPIDVRKPPFGSVTVTASTSWAKDSLLPADSESYLNI